MAKLTDRQKINLIAKWNTGEYDKKQLAKLYKISDVMVGKIVGKEKPKHSDIVEASVLVEKAKKFDKSSTEVLAINQAVEYRLKNDYKDDSKRVRVYDTSFEILDTINGILKKGTIQEKVNVGDGMQQFEPRDINADDALKMANAVDKISQTTNVNSNRAVNEVTVNTQNNMQQTTELNKELVTNTLEAFEDEY